MNTVILSPFPLHIEGDRLVDQFRKAGGNPGNLVFFEALKQQLVYSEIMDTTSDVHAGGGTSIVIPSSNFIRHAPNDPWFQRYIDFLNKTDSPVTFCGLGAQSSNFFKTPKMLVRYGLSPVQIQLFRLVSERCVSIGVRGEFTAECLEIMGIHNHRIIGCPSFFRSLNGVFPLVSRPQMGPCQVTITPGRKSSDKVLELGAANNCYWVVQSINEYPRFLKTFGCEIVSPKWMLKNFSRSLTDSKRITKYSKNYSKVFFDIDSWNQFYKDEQITFAFGTRFHGNMEAFRNGIPALWVVHDSRTKELTDFLGLPHIGWEQLARVKTIEELFEYCDFSTAKKKYSMLSANYVEYLNENHLAHKFTLKN